MKNISIHKVVAMGFLFMIPKTRIDETVNVFSSRIFSLFDSSRHLIINIRILNTVARTRAGKWKWKKNSELDHVSCIVSLLQCQIKVHSLRAMFNVKIRKIMWTDFRTIITYPYSCIAYECSLNIFQESAWMENIYNIRLLVWDLCVH